MKDAGVTPGELLERLRAIPDEERRFTVSAEQARTEFAATAECLAGMPSRRDAAGRVWYDAMDLENLAVELRLPAPRTLMPRYWVRALQAAGSVCRYVVRANFACPEPGHAGACQVTVVTAERGTITVTPPGRRADIGPVLVADLPTAWPALTPAMVDALQAIAGLTLASLPWHLGQDLDFVRRTGLVNCVGAARALVAEGELRGLPVRLASGLLTAPPYSSTRTWAEFLVDETWVPVDPLLLRALARWGLLDPAQWPPQRPVGAILAPLGQPGAPLATHRGDPVELTYPTSVPPAAGHDGGAVSRTRASSSMPRPEPPG